MKIIWRSIVKVTKNTMADIERETLKRNRRRYARMEGVCDIFTDETLYEGGGNEKNLANHRKNSEYFIGESGKNVIETKPNDFK